MRSRQPSVLVALNTVTNKKNYYLQDEKIKLINTLFKENYERTRNLVIYKEIKFHYLF